ncbi:hypothetical protein [Thermaerobacillus caldiproteolyticus]
MKQVAAHLEEILNGITHEQLIIVKHWPVSIVVRCCF